MAEIRRGVAGEGGNDRLPWLEPVEEDAYDDAPAGYGRLAMLGLVLLVAIGMLIAAIVFFNRWSASRADLGEVIRAPTTPYKEKPANPGGLKVDASGIIAEKTGTGSDIDAPLDLTALPEQPITGPGSDRAAKAAVPAPAPGSKPAPAAKPQVAIVIAPPPPPVVKPTTAIPTPAPAPPPVAVSGSGTIQLGAFLTEAKAKSVWKSMSSRFAYLVPMTATILPVQSGDKTLYRLRASGAPAAATCAKLRIAGETCAVADR